MQSDNITRIVMNERKLKIFLLKHILTKVVLVRRIISGRNNYVYRRENEMSVLEETYN